MNTLTALNEITPGVVQHVIEQITSGKPATSADYALAVGVLLNAGDILYQMAIPGDTKASLKAFRVTLMNHVRAIDKKRQRI